ncbi:MAG TPA: glycosyltransferase family 39 protein, partial [Kiritimatiellae bacterium]|nr:glycosyltransferase family 39 protein [Kiritimatiellia bacterium]
MVSMRSGGIRGQAAVVILCGIILLAPGLRTIPLIDRDEPRFARAAVEMISRHEWVVPFFNCDFRFDKPVLTYWLMRAGYALLGVNEAGARLHSLVSAIATALLLMWFARRWISAEAGLLCAIIFLSQLQVLIHGRSAVADMPMVFFVTLCQVLLFEMAARDDIPRAAFPMCYGAMALGFLAKGPIAILVPLLSLALFYLITPRRISPGKLRLGSGLGMALLLVALWGLPALIATRGEFLRVGIGKHVLERGVAAFNARKMLPGYYLLTAFFSLFPWIVFAPAAITWVRRHWGRLGAWLTAWALSPYVIFSFYATQLPHYVMPAFPATALLLAAGIQEDSCRRYGAASRLWAALTSGAYLCVAAVLFALFLLTPGRELGLAARLALGGGLTLVLSLLGLAWTIVHRRWPTAVPILLVAGLSFLAIGAGLRRMVVAVRLVPFFRSLPPETRFAYYRFREPSLVFYSGHCWTRLDQEEELEQFISRGPGRVAIFTAAACDLDDLARAG